MKFWRLLSNGPSAAAISHVLPFRLSTFALICSGLALPLPQVSYPVNEGMINYKINCIAN